MKWFFASGDAPFFFPEQLRELSFFPDLWKGQEELGVSYLPLLWIDYPFQLITAILSKLGFSWFVIDKLWWILVFTLASYGAYSFARKLNIQKPFAFISSIIYSTNTYILLLFGGGQLGVALAYSFVPVSLSFLYSYLITKPSIKGTIRIGVVLGIMLFLDIRIAYVFFVLCIPFVTMIWKTKNIQISPHILLLPIVVFLINAFWIIPTFLYKEQVQNLVVQSQQNSDLAFFSVADFPHSLSLLHPNYPDNMFGRVYFFKSEFLIIPIVAFSLFLVQSNSLIVVFALIAFIGAFLGKGVQEPFGSMYEFFFRYIPGFSLFRDPTKWYVMQSIAYAILIPKTLEVLSKKRYTILFLIFWLFTLRFIHITPVVMTEDYEHLKDILVQNKTFGRTLWLPAIEKFGYKSDLHPAVSAGTVLPESSPSGIIRAFEDIQTKEDLNAVGIRYVIVPQDIEHRIFLNEYKYSADIRESLVHKLDEIFWLEKIEGFQNIAVYTL